MLAAMLVFGSFSLSKAQQNPLFGVPLTPSQAYLRNLLDYEQTRNDKIENTVEFESILDVTLDPAYRADTRAQFPLARYLIPVDEAVVISTRSSTLPEAIRIRQGRVPFFVHPVSMSAFAPSVAEHKIQGNFLASPMASYRSLLVWEDAPSKDKSAVFNLKVSLDAVIGDNLRMLSRAQIEQASAVSLALQHSDREAMRKRGIIFIDEPYSVYLKNFEFGYSLRETPVLEKGVELVPIFSLYSKQGRKRSMLEEMILDQELSAKDFVTGKIIRPLIEHMFFLGMTEGLVGEPHEQNVLAEVKNGKLTGRFFYRDLGGFLINGELRAKAGKPIDFIPKTFKIENLRFDRGNLVGQLEAFLLQSNFYALGAALNKELGVGQRWIQNQALRIVIEQVEQWTGAQVKTLPAAKGAVTRFSRGAWKCSPVYRLIGAGR
jgi:hypothetical protein